MNRPALLEPPEAELPLAEQVELEAMAAARRRERASQLSATIMGGTANPHSISDKLRGAWEALDAEDELERRREALQRIPTPSALIARMREDWPAQAAAVKRLASRDGLSLGEAWAATIEAGVKAIGKRRGK